MGRDVVVRVHYMQDATYLTKLNRAIAKDHDAPTEMRAEACGHLTALIVILMKEDSRRAEEKAKELAAERDDADEAG